MVVVLRPEKWAMAILRDYVKNTGFWDPPLDIFR